MGAITKQPTNSIISVEDMGLDDPIAIQCSGQRNVLRDVADVLWESKRLEELINDADSRIDALVYFFFGSDSGQHAFGNSSAAIPKLTH